jgi:Macrocin-O-methyltransferase (TylF)
MEDTNEQNFEQFPTHIPGHQTERDLQYYREMSEYFDCSLGVTIDKLRNFTKFVPRAEISRFIVKNALFQRILNIHGYIIECGVFLGGGIMTWAQLSSIHEPLNHIRRVIGFDTFEGFPQVHAKDISTENPFAAEGSLNVPAYHDLQECIRLYDLGRPIGHIPRVELVAGNALETIPTYLDTHPHTVVALLYLDFDLYEPTKIAIETFLPRMPRGSVIAFDQLNQSHWPGETMAVYETIGIRNLRIERFPFQPQISFAVLE